MTAALPEGRARRIEAAEGLEATTTAAGVLETREESIRRSMSQQLSPSASPTLEEDVRAPDPAYHEQLVKGSPTDFAKREAGYETAWSGSRSMPPALGSLSRSGSLSHSVSQQAHQSSRTSRFRGPEEASLGTRKTFKTFGSAPRPGSMSHRSTEARTRRGTTPSIRHGELECPSRGV